MKPDPTRLSLFVFIDALGWRLFERHRLFSDIFAVRAPLETILGYSSTCDPTIITGRLPREHGHFSFFAYDPKRSPFAKWRWLQLLPTSLTDRMRVRIKLSRLIQWQLGYSGYFNIYNMPFLRLPLFDYTEKRDIYLPGGINGGCPTIFDHLRRAGIPFYLSNWRRPEAENLMALEKVLTRGDISFAYLYMAEMDGLLHAVGTQSPKVGRKLRDYEHAICRLLEVARRSYGDVRLFVFSDHGMTDIVRHCDLKTRIERLGLRFGRDYAAVYDSTMARFWCLLPGVRERLSAELQTVPEGHVLSDAELAAYGCDFEDHRYGDLFFLASPATLLLPSDMGLRPIAGMHGYAPEDPDSKAAFASNVDDILPPRRLDDLFGLMMREARLEPPPSGSRT